MEQNNKEILLEAKNLCKYVAAVIINKEEGRQAHVSDRTY